MNCPFCNPPRKTKVLQSRASSHGRLRRRRCCPDCGKRFTTYEAAALAFPRVVKHSDRRREDFETGKLREGVNRALHKRPISEEQIQNMLDEIHTELQGHTEKEIDTRQLGAMVMRRLRALDQVAYVRFASFYHRFEDVEEFKREIDALSNALSPLDDQLQLSLGAEDS